MKSKFNKSWNSSKQPRKQVKFVANAPNHIKRTLMGATLDKPLRKKYNRRNIEVKKGDEVKVMRGKFKGKQGKVGTVDVKNSRIQIDGIQRTKSGGEKLITWFHPSNIKIIILDVNDNKRLKSNIAENVSSGEKRAESKIEKDKEDTEKKTIKKTTVSKVNSGKKEDKL